MGDKKHLDRIFQEKLKDFEAIPDDAVWDKISSRLNEKKDDRKVIPIWWKLAGVAAALILLLTVGNLIFDQKDPIQSIPVAVDEKASEESTIDSQSESITSPKENPNKNNLNPEKVQNISDTNKAVVESGISKNTNSTENSEAIQQKKNISASPSINTSNLVTNKDYQALEEVKDNAKKPVNKEAISKEKELIEDQSQKAIVTSETESKAQDIGNKAQDIINNKSPEDLIVEQEKEKIPLTEDVIVNIEDINEEEKESLNRWQVSPNFAPVYFNAFGDGSTIHEQLVYNDKSGDFNLSYGVNVSYAVTKRLTVRSGVNKVNLGYSTNDIIIYENVNASAANTNLFRNIKLNNAAQSLSFVSGNNLGFVQSPSILPGESMAFLNQDMAFIEIPIEIKYRLSDKKVGFSFVGGFSTFLLSDNEVSYELRGDNTILGEANNINDVSYSANFGFGLDYNFSKNMSFNVDPMFKYQISTFNNTSGSFKPYFIGVYSGLNIKF